MLFLFFLFFVPSLKQSIQTKAGCAACCQVCAISSTWGTAVRLCLQPCPGQRLGSWQGAHSSAAQQAVLCHPSNLPGALGARSSHLGSPRASRHQPAFPLHVALSWKRSSVKTQLSPCCCLEERERCLYQHCSPVSHHQPGTGAHPALGC